ncbi:hypothetical protein JOL62DRAFT_393643 [Phyllosticta paracitricarpa]|uniref:Uncharacterized protein n=1 Tax=Phyllosticta paracitricarpa TaxID=2016321 RepID=A0ABR1MSG9_9PEZI
MLLPSTRRALWTRIAARCVAAWNWTRYWRRMQVCCLYARLAVSRGDAYRARPALSMLQRDSQGLSSLDNVGRRQSTGARKPLSGVLSVLSLLPGLINSEKIWVLRLQRCQPQSQQTLGRRRARKRTNSPRIGSAGQRTGSRANLGCVSGARSSVGSRGSRVGHDFCCSGSRHRPPKPSPTGPGNTPLLNPPHPRSSTRPRPRVAIVFSISPPLHAIALVTSSRSCPRRPSMSPPSLWKPFASP